MHKFQFKSKLKYYFMEAIFESVYMLNNTLVTEYVILYYECNHL